MPGKKVVTTKTDPVIGTVVTTEQKVKVWMQVIISFILLIAGLAILTSPNALFPKAIDEAVKKMACGWIGAVIGYWLS